MKIFNDYQNHDAYPHKEAFKFILPVEFKGQIKTVDFFDEEGYKQAIDDYNKKTKELEHEFKEDLFKELNIENNPKRELFFGKVWYLGHAEGFHEIYEYAVDLVDLIR